MATDIVQSLFGLDPYQTQTQQQDALRQQAAAYANMAPQQRAAMSLYQAGGQLAGAGAEGLFGMVNPAVAKAQATEQAMMGLNVMDPQSILAKAQVTTDPRLRIQLQLLAQQAVEKQQAAALKAAQTLAELKKATTEASPIAKLNPKDYTPESWAAYIKSGSTADLRALDTKGVWGDLYQVGGATVQKNSVTGEVRTAVTRPPVSHITLGSAGVIPEDQLDFFAQQYLLGDTQWQVGISRSSGGADFVKRVKLRAAQLAKEQNLSPADVVANRQEIATRLKAQKDFATGPQGKQVTAFNTAIDHLDTLSYLGKALDTGNMQAINAAALSVAAWTGSAPPVTFDAVKQIIAEEIVKSIVPGGGGVTERLELADKIKRSNSPAQLEGSIAAFKKLMAGQLRSLELNYSQTTKRKDFRDKLLPRSIEVLQSLDDGATATPQSAVSQIPTEQPKAAGAPPSLDAYLKSKGY